MAVTYDVEDTFGLTPAAGAVVNESRRSGKVQRFEVPNEEGEIIKHRPAKYREDDITISGKGDANFAAVTVGGFTPNTVKAIEAEGTETNEGEYREFEMVGKAYVNLGGGGGD
ncbi:MAG TPA: hypothetical protein PLA50_02710 [Bacteroidia bacterium]|nr:hypothetical protein [Bacteroidia bacterium]